VLDGTVVTYIKLVNSTHNGMISFKLVNYVTARRRQATDGNIVLRMRFVGSITKSKKNTKSDYLTQIDFNNNKFKANEIEL